MGEYQYLGDYFGDQSGRYLNHLPFPFPPRGYSGSFRDAAVGKARPPVNDLRNSSLPGAHRASNAKTACFRTFQSVSPMSFATAGAAGQWFSLPIADAAADRTSGTASSNSFCSSPTASPPPRWPRRAAVTARTRGDSSWDRTKHAGKNRGSARPKELSRNNLFFTTCSAILNG